MVKNLPANAGDDPWVGKMSCKRKWQPIPVFLPENLMDGGNWWAIVHGVTKSGHNLANKPTTNWSTAIYYVHLHVHPILFL